MKTTIASCLLVIATSLGTGCRQKAATETPAPPASSQIGSGMLIVTGVDDPPTTQKAYHEVSILSPHKALLILKGLAPGRSYSVQWELRDPAGNQTYISDDSSVPTEEVWYFWQPFRPDYKKHKPGRWKWKATVDGQRVFSYDFTVLPPTPGDLDYLALFEKAREETFKAFSYYWLGWNDRFLVAIEHPKDGRDIVLQVSDMDYQFSDQLVSNADRQNGITYRGKASFRFGTYRKWSNERGWTEWTDTRRFQNEFTRQLEQQFGVTMPHEFQKGFGLDFTIELKDGHWRIINGEGDVFVDGMFTSAGLHLEGILYQPNLELVRMIADKLGAQRTLDQVTGNRVKSFPEEISRNSIETMRMLRGRQL